MFCNKCGSQQPDNTTFCTNCGNPMGAAPAYGPQQPYQGGYVQQEEPSAGKVVVWQVILAVLIPLAGWIMGAVQLFGGSNKKNGQALLIAATVAFLLSWLILL